MRMGIPFGGTVPGRYFTSFTPVTASRFL
jgi:hypothetical protein